MPLHIDDSQATIVATVLNPHEDAHEGLWQVEFALVAPDGSTVERRTIEHYGHDWNLKAAPALTDLRQIAESRGWVHPWPDGALA
jgi:hypothetical protein